MTPLDHDSAAGPAEAADTPASSDGRTAPEDWTTEAERYRVAPDAKVRLSEHDPDQGHLVQGGKHAGKKHVKKITHRTEVLQELLYAEGKRRVLIVLQGMDTAGKDGVIRHVFDGVNPQGVSVAKFGVPTPPELAHDYLWRVHPHVPASGHMCIFNRSHYEDVIVVRVHDLVPKTVWSKRYAQINDFERLLAESGTTILKFFLHISKEEQRKRLQSRLDDPVKQWKFSAGDLEERKRWDAYSAAYEAALSRTSTPWAPWYVIPSDRKWFRNLVVGSLLVRTMEDFGMAYPALDLPVPPDQIVVP
jgi:PPK2 family polyphosphate:nucleotide phosphotransferase